MNERIIYKLEYFGVVAADKEVIKSILNHELSSDDYKSITGDTMNDKIDTVVKYLTDINSIEKKVLNIIIGDNSSSLEYVKFLNKKFDVIVHNFKELNPQTKIDLVLFTGGEDVGPSMYNEKIGKYTSINKTRDLIENEVYLRFYGKTLFLGICRGLRN